MSEISTGEQKSVTLNKNLVNLGRYVKFRYGLTVILLDLLSWSMKTTEMPRMLSRI